MNVFDSMDGLSAAVVTAFRDYANQTVRERGVFRVSLSGGSTPRRLYELLAEQALPWQQIHWYWGDERNVPHDHADSNARMVREALLNKLPADSVHAHPVPVDVENPASAATAYETTLRQTWPDQDQPTFDLVLLGLGDDAHTASLFPQTAAIDEKDRWFVENWVPKFDAYRYTLTAPAINAARQRWFLVSGAGKREAFGHASDADREPAQYPVQLVNDAKWFVTNDVVR